ncbi:hypothetical protein CDAR_539111 [Caerostris darwini]|uniref:Uncharacterized protein n=1 Tax=Caerostris darwini TaxID=1538125 RepID=A0AAV4T252_9ARAC|nr:hypothetical protein CDAR_539111 [Caerostris darwini]
MRSLHGSVEPIFQMETNRPRNERRLQIKRDKELNQRGLYRSTGRARPPPPCPPFRNCKPPCLRARETSVFVSGTSPE